MGLTSHDCVAKVRRLLQQKRVGHGGTLDPSATGVLPIAVGKATRLIAFLPALKIYQAKIRFGITTTTDDLEGEIIHRQSASHLTPENIMQRLPQFEGSIEQIPPAYSAIQRGGKRLYELARAGEKVDVPVRTVEVSYLKPLRWYPGEFPELEIEIACGAGTYIRAIARDLGTALEVGGTLAALTRTRSCGFDLDHSLTFAALETQLQEQAFSLVPPKFALKHLEAANLTAMEAKRWCQGQKIAVAARQDSKAIRVHGEDGSFLGIGEIISLDTTVLAPKIVIRS